MEEYSQYRRDDVKVGHVLVLVPIISYDIVESVLREGHNVEDITLKDGNNV